LRCMLPRPVSALVLALAAGIGPTSLCHATSPATPTSIRTETLKPQPSAKMLQANAHLLALRNQLGLDARADFTPHHVITNPQGRTVVRFQQLYEGRRVWAGEAITHLEADGQIKALTQGVKTAVSLAKDTARLSPEQAREAALRNLAPKGPLCAIPAVELVVFPTRFSSGIATRFDAKRGGEVFDPEMSLWTKTPAEPYVLAYEVKTVLFNPKDGHKEINYIVDANTGGILRKWNAVQADGPAQGTGHSFFRGTVPLSTTKATDGTYALRALDKGSLPNPYALSAGVTWTGLMTCYGYAETLGDITTPWNWQQGFNSYEGYPDNEWGDGTILPAAWDGSNPPVFDYSADSLQAWEHGALTHAGETAAVDAHYGLSSTWDFYKSVFNRDGIDNLGTSTFAIVHELQADYWNGTIPYVGNANWSPYFFGMEFGEGDYPAVSGGFLKTFTEIDITGHEMTHGVTQKSVGDSGLIYSGLSGGLNEATSDMLGKMVQAYTDGGATGTLVPDFPAGELAKWAIAYNSTVPAGGLRVMFMPNLDGNSPNEWYDGIELLDVHFSSGPPNRFFYFLCEGASTNASGYTYSPYLPGGMSGIGNDKAAHIWYKTLTEHLAADADFAAARAGSIEAAKELYGAGSAEERAVWNAWGAVNVGPAWGMPDPVRISWPVVHPEGSFIYENYFGLFAKIQIFPTATTVSVHCNVTNTTDTQFNLAQPGWDAHYETPLAPVGTVNPDGTWTIPSFGYYGDPINITATSHADPRQYAKGLVMLISADADTDNETDALDMGVVAMAWGLEKERVPNPSVRVSNGFSELMQPTGVNNWDLALLGEALANAFPLN